MTIQCPVCWRPVRTEDATRRVTRHNDKAGRPCPMAGHHMPAEEPERRSA